MYLMNTIHLTNLISSEGGPGSAAPPGSPSVSRGAASTISHRLLSESPPQHLSGMYKSYTLLQLRITHETDVIIILLRV